MLLVIPCSVTSQLQNLSSEILENGGQVDRCTGTNTLGVIALLQETMDTTNGELETSLGRARLRLASRFTTGSLSRL